MRHLLLLRHGEAVQSPQFSDRDRPLTPAGRQAAARAGALIAEWRIKLDLVLVSDARRTRETWEAAAQTCGGKPHFRLVEKIYRAERADLLDLVRDLSDSARAVLIVGHNPALGEFAHFFAGDGDAAALARLRRGVPPGALAAFTVERDDWRALRWGEGALTHFVV